MNTRGRGQRRGGLGGMVRFVVAVLMFYVVAIGAVRAAGVPQIAQVADDSGSVSGGYTVSIFGSNFTGVTSVMFGNASATGVTLVTDGQMSVTVPAGVAGSVDVTVTTSFGTATLANAFTYVESPALSSVSVQAGPSSGGISVTINGTNLSGATSVTFGGTTASFTINSATSITANTPPHAAGTVNIAVTTPGGTVVLDSAFTYVGPTISSVTPSVGTVAGNTSVTITGTNLTNASAVTFGGTVATITANTATSVTVTTPAHVAGNVNVVVTTSDGTATASNAYTYLAAGSVSSVLPSSGTVSGGTSVTITGANLANASAVTFGGTAATITANTATSVTVTTPVHIAGSVDVVVTTSGGATTVTSAFTYTPNTAITQVSPASGLVTGGTVVTITGTGLTGASAVTFGGVAAAITSNSATSLVVTTPAHAAGSVDVVVTTGSGAVTASGAFAYQARPDPANNPTVVAIVRAQSQAVRSFGNAQLSNFSQRLNALHGSGRAPSSFGLSVNQANVSDETAWARAGDVVSYDTGFAAPTPTRSLRQGLRRTGLNSGADDSRNTLAAAAAGDGNLPNLPSANGERPQALSLWIGGAIDFGRQKTGTRDNPRFQTSGISFGGDYRFSEQLTLGVGGGYSYSITNTDSDGSRSVGQGVMVVGYGSYRPTPHWYIDGMLGVGSLNFDLTRYLGATEGFAGGTRNGRQVFASLASGYEFTGEAWLFAPYAKLDLMTASLNDYTETTSAAGSASALTYFRQTVRGNTASLGVRSEMRYAVAAGTFAPELQLAYQHSLQSAGQAGIAYADQAAAGAAYFVTDTSQDSSQWQATLGLKLLTKNNISLALYYLRSIANAQVSAQSFRFLVSGRF